MEDVCTGVNGEKSCAGGVDCKHKLEEKYMEHVKKQFFIELEHVLKNPTCGREKLKLCVNTPEKVFKVKFFKAAPPTPYILNTWNELIRFLKVDLNNYESIKERLVFINTNECAPEQTILNTIILEHATHLVQIEPPSQGGNPPAKSPKKRYEACTIKELIGKARSRKIKIPSSANKAQIISILRKHN